MMKIANWLVQNTHILQAAGISSARLDCLIILEHTLKLSRVDILTRQNEEISDVHYNELDKLLARRQLREPIAYIVGVKEFYGRLFKVNNKVLIPRPETEEIINLALSLPLKNNPGIADVGTGSGILAITLALEFPKAKVYAFEINQDALRIAKKNSNSLHADVHFMKYDLLDNSDTAYDLIVANLPYVSASQQVSPETAFEPHLALYAENDGLELVYTLLTRISNETRLTPGGYLLLESEPRQHRRIQHFAEDLGYSHIRDSRFIQLFQLVS